MKDRIELLSREYDDVLQVNLNHIENINKIKESKLKFDLIGTRI